MSKSVRRKITQADLDKVAGYSAREAAEIIGFSKSTINYARERARINGGRLPYEKPEKVAQEPDGDQSGHYHEKWSGDEGEITVVISEKISNEAILRKFGHDPDVVQIVGVLEETHWQYDGENWNHRYKFKTTRHTEDDYDIDLPALLASAQEQAAFSAPKSSMNRSVQVNWADAQTGKTDHRGGVPELAERVYRIHSELERYMDRWQPETGNFIDGGDSIENFENTAGQMGTNGLSLMDQIDLEATFEFDYIKMMAERLTEVHVKGVGSNHCRWRQGKGTLGTPADDWGLFIKRQLEKQFRMDSRYDHITFQEPNPYEEFVLFDTYGTKTAVFHGHQMGTLKGIDNFLLKMFMGSDAALADIISLSHFHNFYQRGAGRNPHTKRERTVLGNPTLDNGSSWFANTSGSDSDPGLLVYIIDENGLNQESLTILR